MAYLNKIYVFIGLGVLIMALGGDGAITMSPTNKAVLLGSARVNMSCTSSYGFQAIGWSYTPIGSSTPTTISFSGSNVASDQQPFYAVEQSSGSEQNNLIIHSATTSRAGTYICNEGASQASAQLIVINSDPVCSMTPNVTELKYNQAVQMSCRITYTSNLYVSVDMIWSNGSFVSNATTNTTTSANLTTATSTITQIPGYSSVFPIYSCTTTFKITGNSTGSANNAPDYSKSTQLNSPIPVVYLRPANPASSITGAKDGDQVYLGTTVTCTVDGNPTPSYSWLDATYGNTTNTSSIQIWHSGQYQCTAWNTAGSTSVSINVTTYITTAAPTTSTSTTSTTTITSRSTVQSGSGGGGGLSDGSRIGIGVGIGLGGTLVLVGILFVVLCRRNDWIKRTKTDDEIINKEEVSRRNNTAISDRPTPQYEQLITLSVNPGPTYEQLSPSTVDVDAAEQSQSDRTTYVNLGYTLNANESHSSDYEGLQHRELRASDACESIQQTS